MKLIITRHGETEENKKGILQGHLHGRLSVLGIEQARKLGERLKGEDIDLIISSDLARALDTAKIVAEFHPGAEFILEKRLRERFLGNLQGKTKEELGIPKERLISDFVKDTNAEDAESFFARGGEIIEIVRNRSEKNILLVGHNGICKSIIGNLLRVKNLKEIEGLKNTSVSIFEEEYGEMKIRLLNCVRHLDEDSGYK